METKVFPVNKKMTFKRTCSDVSSFKCHSNYTSSEVINLFSLFFFKIQM